MPFTKGNIPWNKGLTYSVKKNVSGNLNPNWRGGKSITPEGYVYIRDGKGYRILEHRHVMEQHLGRLLEKNEVVHHIDGDKTNNNINNLFVCTMSAHRTIENHLAELYKKEHFNSDESRREFVKLYANLGTDNRAAHGKLTGLTTS